MILVLLVVSAIALFLSFIYVHQNTLRISLSVIFAALLVTSIVFVSKNDGQHYGMVKTTTTTTQSFWDCHGHDAGNYRWDERPSR
ncbi:hypothetical protein WP50_05060 [Lactiplantibacillus plantarum]|nr:hypothetical protein WP50_05050 [Lactiplantibacillus plantarum]KLD61100.1 hypothetical protein WP50_05060 [Lactiplantibacillus plantarum]